jgi:hypothetical protein
MKTVVAMREASSPDTLFATSPETAAARAPKDSPAARPARSAFVPLLLGLLAISGSLSFQAWVQEQDRQQLQLARGALQPTVEQATKLRQSLDRLANDTQALADAGNGNARVLVDELRKRGVTINTNAARQAAPAAPPTR